MDLDGKRRFQTRLADRNGEVQVARHGHYCACRCILYNVHQRLDYRTVVVDRKDIPARSYVAACFEEGCVVGVVNVRIGDRQTRTAAVKRQQGRVDVFAVIRYLEGVAEQVCIQARRNVVVGISCDYNRRLVGRCLLYLNNDIQEADVAVSVRIGSGDQVVACARERYNEFAVVVAREVDHGSSSSIVEYQVVEVNSCLIAVVVYLDGVDRGYGGSADRDRHLRVAQDRNHRINVVRNVSRYRYAGRIVAGVFARYRYRAGTGAPVDGHTVQAVGRVYDAGLRARVDRGRRRNCRSREAVCSQQYVVTVVRAEYPVFFFETAFAFRYRNRAFIESGANRRAAVRIRYDVTEPVLKVDQGSCYVDTVLYRYRDAHRVDARSKVATAGLRHRYRVLTCAGIAEEERAFSKTDIGYNRGQRRRGARRTRAGYRRSANGVSTITAAVLNFNGEVPVGCITRAHKRARRPVDAGYKLRERRGVGLERRAQEGGHSLVVVAEFPDAYLIPGAGNQTGEGVAQRAAAVGIINVSDEGPRAVAQAVVIGFLPKDQLVGVVRVVVA